jgi:hypothetical protein
MMTVKLVRLGPLLVPCSVQTYDGQAIWRSCCAKSTFRTQNRLDSCKVPGSHPSQVGSTTLHPKRHHYERRRIRQQSAITLMEDNPLTMLVRAKMSIYKGAPGPSHDRTLRQLLGHTPLEQSTSFFLGTDKPRRDSETVWADLTSPAHFRLKRVASFSVDLDCLAGQASKACPSIEAKRFDLEHGQYPLYILA